jgi:hypothetical protein
MPTMNSSAFKRSLGGKRPPAGLSSAVKAVWWAGKDDWDKAHDIVMNEDDADCAWAGFAWTVLPRGGITSLSNRRIGSRR